MVLSAETINVIHVDYFRAGDRKIKDEEAKAVAESTSLMEYLFTDVRNHHFHQI